MKHIAPSNLILFILLQLATFALSAQDESHEAVEESSQAIHDQQSSGTPAYPPGTEAPYDYAMEMVRRSLSGDREAMKWVISEHLGRIVEGPVAPGNFWGVPEGVDQIELVSEIVSARANNHDQKRIKAIGMDWLAKMKDHRAVNVLSRIAYDRAEDISLRGSAMRSLSREFPHFAKTRLQELALDPDPMVREIVVVHAAMILPDPAAEQILTALSQDQSNFVRVNATNALEFWRKHTLPRIPGAGSRQDGQSLTEGAGKSLPVPSETAVMPPSRPIAGATERLDGASNEREASRPLQSPESIQSSGTSDPATTDQNSHRWLLALGLGTLIFGGLITLWLWRFVRGPHLR